LKEEDDDKLSYCSQTAQLLCTRMLYAVLSRAALWRMTAIYWPDFPTFTSPLGVRRISQWGGIKHPTCSLADMIVDEQAILC